MLTCKNGVNWLFKLEEDFSWDSGYPIDQNLKFVDIKGKTRMLYKKDGRITITKEYAWDGCTPKLCFFDILIGTPDGVVHKDSGRPKTYYASLVHDSLYQFLPDIPKSVHLTQREADWFFLKLMEKYEFAPRWIYWAVVRLLGVFFIRTRRWTRKTIGQVIVDTEDTTMAAA